MTRTTKTPGSYTSADVKNLSGRDAVRTNPGMFIGGRDAAALVHVAAEVLDNSVDEAVQGHGTEIWLEVKQDQTIVIRDNGRGMPIGMSTTAAGETMPTPQMLATKLYAGGKFGKGSYDTSGGLHGVGLKAAAFMSMEFAIDIWRDKQHYHQEMRDGTLEIDKPLIEPYTGPLRGTKIAFRFDPTVFDEEVHVDSERLVNKVRLASYACEAIFHFSDERTGAKETFRAENGIEDLVRHLADETKPVAGIKNVIRLNKKIELERDDPRNWKKEDSLLFLDVALLPTDESAPGEMTMAYTNVIPNPDGGDHLSGVKTGLARAIKRWITKNSLTKSPDTLDSIDILQGLALVVAVRMNSPQFASQHKTRLAVAPVNALTAGLADELITTWLENHDKEGTTWAKSIEANREARLEFVKTKKAISAARRDKLDTRLGKIAGIPNDTPPEKAELFLVEGDSAGGSATQGRENRFQAVLPFKGVSKNVLGIKASEILANVELATLAAAIGLEYRAEHDEKDLRYHKIILLADADPDGGHINLLWLTIFYAEFRGLLTCEEHGSHIFLANPPLFSVESRKTKDKTYVRDQAELDTLLKGKRREDYKVDRFKGLGEMNMDQLWATCLDPAARNLSQITLGDTHSMLLSVMGKGPDAAQFRKDYLRHLGPVSDAEELPDIA